VSVFTEHPASVGETYFQHLETASSFGSRMIVAGMACMLHGVFPFLFVTTGSKTVKHLHERMIIHRSRVKAAPELIDQGAYI
jgi:phosphate/sulfate permease